MKQKKSTNHTNICMKSQKSTPYFVQKTCFPVGGSGGCYLYIGIVICRLTFFEKCDILNFEGIPETVGGSLSLGESAVAISAGRRAGRFLLPEGSE